MRPSLNWAFAEACDRAANVEDIGALFMREIRALGFSYAACASHVDPLKAPQDAVIIVDYPKSWLERFSARRYALRDPVFCAARTQALPFQWSDARFRARLAPDQIAILNEAAEMGLGDGFTIPIHAPNALPASCSLVIGPDGVDPLRVREAHWHAVYAHERARQLLGRCAPRARPRLSPREKECVELMAQGKTDYEISVILSLSEHTIHNRIRRIQSKYGLATRVQVVVRSLHAGEIRLEDVAC